MFNIRIEDRGERPGEIIIGAHRERFGVDLSVWSRDEYRASWTRGCGDVLQRGYGRFLASVGAPGAGAWTTWICRVDSAEAAFCKSVLLSSLTADFAAPADAETLEGDYAERNSFEETLNWRRCPLQDIAAFEVLLRGAKFS